MKKKTTTGLKRKHRRRKLPHRLFAVKASPYTINLSFSFFPFIITFPLKFIINYGNATVESVILFVYTYSSISRSIHIYIRLNNIKNIIIIKYVIITCYPFILYFYFMSTKINGSWFRKIKGLPYNCFPKMISVVPNVFNSKKSLFSIFKSENKVFLDVLLSLVSVFIFKK